MNFKNMENNFTVSRGSNKIKEIKIELFEKSKKYTIPQFKSQI